MSRDATLQMTPGQLAALLARNLPQVDWHGEVIEQVEPGRVRMSMALSPGQISDDLPRGSGQRVVSGPLMMGMAETAMYGAVFSAYGEDFAPVVLNFNMSFFRLAGTERLIVEATVLRKARKICFLDAKLFSEAGCELIAQVSATYSVGTNAR